MVAWRGMLQDPSSTLKKCMCFLTDCLDKCIMIRVTSPGTNPRMEAPMSVGSRIVWQSCHSSGNGSKAAAGPADEAAVTAVGAAARMRGRMKGMVKMPRMFELTVSSSARETLAPSCCQTQSSSTAGRRHWCLHPASVNESLKRNRLL